MEKFLAIVSDAIEMNATDIHLVDGLVPLFRVNRALIRDDRIEAMNKYDLEGLMEAIVGDSLE